MNLGVLASHEGTTLQSLFDAFAGGRIPERVSVVVSNNGDSGALVYAGELVVRLPAAPTTPGVGEALPNR
jgi:folate-dependent phosphoribosylglycinamide formyltransferase PurN